MPNTTVTLNYIDKLTVALYDTGKQVHRSMTIIIVMSILMLGLLLNIVAIPGELNMGSIKLTFSSSFILIILSWSLTYVYIRFLGLTKHELYLFKTIRRLYKNIGFEDDSILDTTYTALEYPNTITLHTYGKFVNKLFLVFGIIILFFPLAIQLFAIYTLYQTASFLFLSSFIFLSLIMITIISSQVIDGIKSI